MSDYPVIDKIVADFNERARDAKTLADQLTLAYDLNKTQAEGLAVAIESMIAAERGHKGWPYRRYGRHA